MSVQFCDKIHEATNRTIVLAEMDMYTLNEEIKERLESVKSEKETLEIIKLLELIELLVAKINKIPDWVWDNKCCPPGESCCNCG